MQLPQPQTYWGNSLHRFTSEETKELFELVQKHAVGTANSEVTVHSIVLWVNKLMERKTVNDAIQTSLEENPTPWRWEKKGNHNVYLNSNLDAVFPNDHPELVVTAVNEFAKSRKEQS